MEMVKFPLIVAALDIAMIIGDWSCAFASFNLGTNRNKGESSIQRRIRVSVITPNVALTLACLAFRHTILIAFGAQVNGKAFHQAFCCDVPPV